MTSCQEEVADNIKKLDQIPIDMTKAEKFRNLRKSAFALINSATAYAAPGEPQIVGTVPQDALLRPREGISLADIRHYMQDETETDTWTMTEVFSKLRLQRHDLDWLRSKGDSDTAYKELAGERQRQIQSLQKKIEDADEAMRDTAKQIDGYRGRHITNEVHESKMQELQKEHDGALKELESRLQAQHSKDKSDLATQQSEKEKRLSDTFQTEKTSLQDTIPQYEKQLVDAETARQVATSEVDRLTEQLTDNQKAVEQRNQELADKRNELGILQSDHERLTSKHDSLVKDHDQVKSVSADIEHTNDERARELAEEREKVEQLIEKHRQLTNNHSILVGDHGQTQSALTETREKSRVFLDLIYQTLGGEDHLVSRDDFYENVQASVKPPPTTDDDNDTENDGITLHNERMTNWDVALYGQGELADCNVAGDLPIRLWLQACAAVRFEKIQRIAEAMIDAARCHDIDFMERAVDYVMYAARALVYRAKTYDSETMDNDFESLAMAALQCIAALLREPGKLCLKEVPKMCAILQKLIDPVMNKNVLLTALRTWVWRICYEPSTTTSLLDELMNVPWTETAPRVLEPPRLQDADRRLIIASEKGPVLVEDGQMCLIYSYNRNDISRRFDPVHLLEIFELHRPLRFQGNDELVRPLQMPYSQFSQTWLQRWMTEQPRQPTRRNFNVTTTISATLAQRFRLPQPPPATSHGN
ncbi:hypothetical protein CBER1_05226 [Cercospora berteroae]|uniref:Uncharacterized protein n=1 Tax=Cercospora berteroae TaxID=357750 RepID=A0A2S6BRT3_9PEZI|nr:hypothetical protein CBER1_05226 [Cercospora berteroae]